MSGRAVGQLLLSVAAICMVSVLNPLPLNAQPQAGEQEKLHGSLFYQCRKKIEEKEAAGCISQREALKLSSDLAGLQTGDSKYTNERYKSSGNREYLYMHDPALVSQAQSIIDRLNLQTTINEQWKSEAKERSWGITRPGQLPWPPRDEGGQIISGPRRGGTAEQMGWPMYGWSEED